MLWQKTQKEILCAFKCLSMCLNARKEMDKTTKINLRKFMQYIGDEIYPDIRISWIRNGGQASPVLWNKSEHIKTTGAREHGSNAPRSESFEGMYESKFVQNPPVVHFTHKRIQLKLSMYLLRAIISFSMALLAKWTTASARRTMGYVRTSRNQPASLLLQTSSRGQW